MQTRMIQLVKHEYSDEEAYNLVVDYLKGRKQAGTPEFSILDIISDLELSVEQARRTLDRLECEKKMHWLE